MKKYHFFAILMSLVIPQLFAQNQISFSSVEVSFTFSRQSGYASNQYAVWVENASGVVVKTLNATPFASKGGWKSRGTALAPLPQWAKNSNLSTAGASEIDAFTSATPATGKVSYIWNGTDKTGKKVDSGEYRIFVEAALRMSVRVVYSGVIRNDSRGNLRLEEHYYDGNTELTGSKIPEERKMISSVTVTIK